MLLLPIALFASNVLVDDAPMCGHHTRHTYDALWDSLTTAGATINYTTVVGRFPPLEDYDVLIIMHHGYCPDADFSNSQIDQIIQYVCDGGNVIVMPIVWDNLEPHNKLLTDSRWSTGLSYGGSGGFVHSTNLADFPPYTTGVTYLHFEVTAEINVETQAYPFAWNEDGDQIIAAVSYPTSSTYPCSCNTGGRILALPDNHTFEAPVVGYVEPMDHKFMVNTLLAMAGIDSLDPCVVPPGIPGGSIDTCLEPAQSCTLFGVNLAVPVFLKIDTFTIIPDSYADDSTWLIFTAPLVKQGNYAIQLVSDTRKYNIGTVQIYCDWVEIGGFDQGCYVVGDTVRFTGENFWLEATLDLISSDKVDTITITKYEITSDSTGWFVVPPGIDMGYYDVYGLRIINDDYGNYTLGYVAIPCRCPTQAEEYVYSRSEIRPGDSRIPQVTGTPPDSCLIVNILVEPQITYFTNADSFMGVPILWPDRNPDRPITIECSKDGGATWRVWGSGLENTGTFPFVPADSGGSYLFIVTAEDSFGNVSADTFSMCFYTANAPRKVWFPTVYGRRCSTVYIPLYIDGLNRSSISSSEFVFAVDTSVLIVEDIITAGSHTDGWSVDAMSISPDSTIVIAEISGITLTSGPEGHFLYLKARVPCDASGGDYCPIRIIDFQFNAGEPFVTWEPGLFIVEFEPDIFTCDLRLNRLGDVPTEDRVLSFGALPSGSENYDPGLDVMYVPPPVWQINSWFPIDDADYPHITRLSRDVRGISPPEKWYVATVDESLGVAKWNSQCLPEGEFRVDSIIDMKRDTIAYFGLDDTLVIEWFIPGLEPVYLKFQRGWNLVSSPVLPSGEREISDLFETGFGAFKYVAQARSYMYADYVRDGEGYWVWADSFMEFPIVGSPVEGYRWQVYRGWNLVGAPNDTLLVDSITISPTGNILGVYSYNGSNYQLSSSLDPGNGYWMLCSETGVLHAPYDYRKRPEPKPQAKWLGKLLTSNPVVSFGYAPTSDVGLDRGDVALPPVPPDGEPRNCVLIADSIELSTSLSPSMEWELLLREATAMRFDLPYGVQVEMNDRTFINGDEASFPAGTYKLVASEVLPKEFELVECMPNPFNAKTEIIVALPEDGDLRVEVVSLLGKVVWSKKGDYPAGIARIVWDGRTVGGGELPSGQYFVRVKFGKSSVTTKVILMK